MLAAKLISLQVGRTSEVYDIRYSAPAAAEVLARYYCWHTGSATILPAALTSLQPAPAQITLLRARTTDQYLSSMSVSVRALLPACGPLPVLREEGARATKLVGIDRGGRARAARRAARTGDTRTYRTELFTADDEREGNFSSRSAQIE